MFMQCDNCNSSFDVKLKAPEHSTNACSSKCLVKLLSLSHRSFDSIKKLLLYSYDKANPHYEIKAKHKSKYYAWKTRHKDYVSIRETPLEVHPYTIEDMHFNFYKNDYSLRSKLEQRFYEWLWGNDFSVIYEPLKIKFNKRKPVRYIPDFLIMDNVSKRACFVEVKGRWETSDRDKIKLFKGMCESSQIDFHVLDMHILDRVIAPVLERGALYW